MQLLTPDVVSVLRNTPALVRHAMRAHPGHRFLAGGFIRAIIAREPPSDIDLFVSGESEARDLAAVLTATSHKETDNAISIDGYPYPVQVIHRWTFATPAECIRHFDFTIAAAAIWWDGEAWMSACDDSFYADIAAKRLHYRYPPNAAPGGSMVRLLKFAARGYVAPATTVAAIVARLARVADEGRICGDLTPSYGDDVGPTRGDSVGDL